MAPTIRRATAADAAQWLDLVQATLGAQYPAKCIYDPAWIVRQFDSDKGEETWIVENNGRIDGGISFLKPPGPPATPIANLGRNLFRPEAVADGSAEMLVRSVTDLAAKRNQTAVVRVAASDNAQQVLFEKLGYNCAGFQPLKHLLQQRIGVLFYVRPAGPLPGMRMPLSESLPQVIELGSAVLQQMQISNPPPARDGAVGYPLQTELTVQEGTLEDFQLARSQAENFHPPVEVSGRFSFGSGLMRLTVDSPPRAFIGQQDKKTVAGLSYSFDEQDRCARIMEAFSCDDVSMGPLLGHALRVMQEQLNAVYTEVDILASAPRLLKTAEQLGFVPVAYFAAFSNDRDRISDVVKMVKLNLPYSLEASEFTTHAQNMVKLIDHNFADQKLGLAIINLLRPLSMFAGLGDGELRKIARLFVQKLFRPGEQVFAKGDSGDEAYIVLRGKISIQLEKDSPAVAQLGDGKIFGELAFLDGAPRNAFAVASQPSILLVMKRSGFTEVVRREPNLGMMVMRNLAQDLAMKLRSVNEALSAKKAAAKA